MLGQDPRGLLIDLMLLTASVKHVIGFEVELLHPHIALCAALTELVAALSHVPAAVCLQSLEAAAVTYARMQDYAKASNYLDKLVS